MTGHDLTDHVDRAVRTLPGVAVHDLGAVSLHQRLALGADVAGHHQLDPVSLGPAEQGVSDTGVARGRVDDRLVVGQRSAALAVLDHRERGAVLDRPARIEPLGLGVDLHAGELALEHADAQQRRVAHEPRDPCPARASHVNKE